MKLSKARLYDSSPNYATGQFHMASIKKEDANFSHPLFFSIHLRQIAMRVMVNLRLIHSNHHMISPILLETTFMIIVTEGPFFSIRHNLDPIGLHAQID